MKLRLQRYGDETHSSRHQHMAPTNLARLLATSHTRRSCVRYGRPAHGFAMLPLLAPGENLTRPRAEREKNKNIGTLKFRATLVVLLRTIRNGRRKGSRS